MRAGLAKGPPFVHRTVRFSGGRRDGRRSFGWTGGQQTGSAPRAVFLCVGSADFADEQVTGQEIPHQEHQRPHKQVE